MLKISTEFVGAMVHFLKKVVIFAITIIFLLVYVIFLDPAFLLHYKSLVNSSANDVKYLRRRNVVYSVSFSILEKKTKYFNIQVFLVILPNHRLKIVEILNAYKKFGRCFFLNLIDLLGLGFIYFHETTLKKASKNSSSNFWKHRKSLMN